VTATLGTLTRRVEHVDTDASGVMHFARYPSLLETAALEGLERLGIGLDALAADGLDLVVAEAKLTYRHPARFLDRLGVTVGLAHLGAASLRVAGEVTLAETTLVTGTLVFGAVGRTTGTPSVLPGRVTEVLKEFV
jgi:acyl-CoA thioester hydrolase